VSDARPILLVLHALGLGDFLTAVPALRALARGFPRHRRVLATTSGLAPLALRADLADEVLPTVPFRPLVWRDYRPAVAVNLHDGGPESHRVMLDTHPAHVIAFSNPLVPQSWDGPAWSAAGHDVQRWCRLLDASGIAADPSQIDIALPSRPVPVEAIGATIVHPGAGSGARRWPLDRWADVARAESSEGRVVLLTGRAAERPLALAVARRAELPTSAVWAGRTDVLMLASLVHHAARVVSGDTAVAPLATALRTPSVVLFGPTSPSACGPPTYRPWHRVLWTGRHGDRYAARTDAGLLEIAVDDVLRALADLPPATRVAPSPRPHEARARRRAAAARPTVVRALRAHQLVRKDTGR
jgi:ADP-heptose:LPS heptosyltransferase